ncbi:hypothetical protein GMRT_12645 [Giardia muris]|uniref:Uncharacterized protein n=1 Tax=Giardia muris TaxID=5742 RepID=A0A4Z1SPV6_GIAMU|nr:hypothetical protein GMRT_12645 [Giardia muris]|eukprot:TNJ27836.1 hypothetical protein GMRT_12645 [Giardia muris]
MQGFGADPHPGQNPGAILRRIKSERQQQWHEENLRELRKVQARAAFESRERLTDELCVARRELKAMQEAVKEASVIARRERLRELYQRESREQDEALRARGLGITGCLLKS